MKLTVTFNISDESRRAISERMPADWGPFTRDFKPTREAIQTYLAARVLEIFDDECRIWECVQLGCLDTDDDHDHVEGPKR
jgi:hypothetical protein